MDYIRRSRAAIWGAVLAVLLMTFMSMWRTVEDEAVNTAVIVASKRILERANYYKQQYLLNSETAQGYRDHQFKFSRTGWLLPIKREDIDCGFWLAQLYPDTQIMGVGQPQSMDMSRGDSFHCRYQYTEQYQIDLLLEQERFSVKANILSL